MTGGLGSGVHAGLAPAAGTDGATAPAPGGVPALEVSVVDMFEAAAFDEVTGTWGRRAWRTRAEREIAARAPDTGAALLIVDVDHFKDYNDHFGHLAGDVVLGQVVWAIRRGLRHVDLIGRFGGDELAILLTEIHDPTPARHVAERLRREVERHTMRLPAALVEPSSPPIEITGVTVSIGAAVASPDAAPSLAELLAVADSAMYAAKAAGRNTIRITDVPSGQAPPALHRPDPAPDPDPDRAEPVQGDSTGATNARTEGPHAASPSVCSAGETAGGVAGNTGAQPSCYRCRDEIHTDQSPEVFTPCPRPLCGHVARRDHGVATALAQLTRHTRWATAGQVGPIVGLTSSQAFRALDRLRCRELVEIRTAPHMPSRSGPHEHRLTAAGRNALRTTDTATDAAPLADPRGHPLGPVGDGAERTTHPGKRGGSDGAR